jgi:uncharacterized protein (DUF1330 family)
VPAYIIAHVTITDDGWMASEYMTVLHQLFEKHGGKQLAVGAPEHLEGAPLGLLTVIDEFPDIETARAFWNDPEYQRVIPIRQAGSDCQVVLMDGGVNVPG